MESARAPVGAGAAARLQAEVPDIWPGLCEVLSAALGEARVDVVADSPDGPVTVVRAPGRVPRDSEVAHHEPLRCGTGREFATLVVVKRGPEPFTERQTAHVRAVGESLCAAREVAVLQGVVFDLEEQVARAPEALSDGAGQLAHDINNPLAATSMSLEIARDEVTDPLVAKLLDRAVNGTRRMKRMVADLVAFSAAPGPGVANLEDSLVRLCDEFSGTAVAEVRGVGTDVLLPFTPAHLDLLMVALLENAVKFAHDDQDPLVEVVAGASSERDGWVRVSVHDAGRGIAPDHHDRVFTPTVRLDRRVPGLGLGLATVRRLVAGAGGRTGVAESHLGGAEVWFEVPSVAG
ncbi:sensor histidine kinase [Nocardioides yefusunii]|uniref:Sensor-like histidine kinase SenX3 n=1 Tax=Nocardioides yefusunii TaxID=2500546 RepID=A0ABW1QV23_9ACTN|nr:HAMP domain-containing sensor histidine kinase [Nocardioides yefusunii]